MHAVVFVNGEGEMSVYENNQACVNVVLNINQTNKITEQVAQHKGSLGVDWLKRTQAVGQG